MFFIFCFFIVSSSLFVGCCFGTHFRGGQFWFRSMTNTIPNQIEIGLRLTWRMSYSPTTRCSRDVIDSGSLIGPETPGYVMCDVGCQGRVGDVSIRCLDYSSVENWMTGERVYNHTFDGNGSYQVVWEGEGWFKDDVSWQFRMTLNLNVRPTTGKVNSSPRAILPSIPINVQRGCNTNIRITVVDDDGDVIRCRWAESIRQECGGVCHEPSGVGQPIAILDETTCIVRMDATSQLPDQYILAVQLEDFDPSDHLFQSPLSSVPLQFSVGLYSANETNTTVTTTTTTTTTSSSSSSNETTRADEEPSWCQMGPVFIPPTPDDGSCLTMDRKENISLTIASKAKDSVTIVFKIRSVGPVYDDVSQTEIAINASIFYVIVSMTADDVNLEDRNFCFEATDNFGFVSNKTCFNITFGLHPPQATSSTYDASMQRILINFNQSQQIERPSVKTLVDIYDDEDDQLLVSYDTTDADQVTFTKNTISMAPTNQMINNSGCYYIHLQPGVVLSSCGTPSLAVVNTTSLNFTTNRSGGSGAQCGWTTTATRQTTTASAITTTNTDASHLPPSSSDSSSSSFSPSSAAVSGGGDNASSWDYRWLVVIIVCSVLLFSLVILIAACVIKTRRSRDRDRRSRQQRFFSTLNARGIYNWTYDQQQQQQQQRQQQQQQQRTNSTPGTTTTTTTTDTTVVYS